ncbi:MULTISPECIES: cyclodeaminase/cyclohydrolase family protein [Cryobacterium]|uniref:cyclodeaminase/cyclohydrolase family protein n=1 Tax=Cryobacterium TaxID=69578 RepID=UPI001E282E31|nr:MULTISPECIES: cyclodeaminase/cyclohydrolase family protein [Cryobacterium]
MATSSGLASREPTPGGGGAAIHAAQGAALVARVGRYTAGSKYEQYAKLVQRIISAADALVGHHRSPGEHRHQRGGNQRCRAVPGKDVVDPSRCLPDRKGTYLSTRSRSRRGHPETSPYTWSSCRRRCRAWS